MSQYKILVEFKIEASSEEHAQRLVAGELDSLDFGPGLPPFDQAYLSDWVQYDERNGAQGVLS